METEVLNSARGGGLLMYQCSPKPRAEGSVYYLLGVSDRQTGIADLGSPEFSSL